MKLSSFAYAFLLFSLLFLSAFSEGEEFNYDEASGIGPSNWGGDCNTGQQQSPIDIGPVIVSSQLNDLQRNYRPALANLSNRTHDVAVEWTGNAGSITINGTVFRVVNCHWHSPSEHTINGTRYPLEIHIVHRSDQDKFAVVGILYRHGLADPFVSSLLPNILSLRTQDRHLGLVNPERIGFPGSSYFRYNGSLTVPNCSENVLWTVFQQTKTVSRSSVEALRAVLAPQNRNNSRPTQPLNDRTVLFHPGDNNFP